MHPAWQQASYGVRLEWGPSGATALQHPDGALVVVDVLSWTTTAGVAVERGTAVRPFPWKDARADAVAAEHAAQLAVGRREATPEHPWSLSPAALRAAPACERLVLPSPNGSTVAAQASGVVVAASLRNAEAVASWLQRNGFGSPERPVLLVPAGERWPDGTLRPALEDLLGAGAVARHLEGVSPEARAAAELVEALDVAAAVRTCGSGRELADGGYGADVEVAVELGSSDVVPVLQDGWFRPA